MQPAQSFICPGAASALSLSSRSPRCFQTAVDCVLEGQRSTSMSLSPGTLPMEHGSGEALRRSAPPGLPVISEVPIV